MAAGRPRWPRHTSTADGTPIARRRRRRKTPALVHAGRRRGGGGGGGAHRRRQRRGAGTAAAPPQPVRATHTRACTRDKKRETRRASPAASCVTRGRRHRVCRGDRRCAGRGGGGRRPRMRRRLLGLTPPPPPPPPPDPTSGGAPRAVRPAGSAAVPRCLHAGLQGGAPVAATNTGGTRSFRGGGRPTRWPILVGTGRST